ncbi:hypothetical protein K8F61_17100 [Microbacterium resistens]|uniref:Tail assembly chaperone n=1 Tax=Microbacterium resistens TaxID=156977 RepID=A0ABY3RRA0_9MICO|nr:hypothetical protein [Microbacterium resistens]UGS26322.1 hypothetical protein K8F61_17100 [Microbacterium resistens]
MGYKLPDWKKSLDQNMFDFETDTGEKFLLPKAEYLTGKQVQRFAEANSVEGGVYTVLDEVAPGLGTALADVPVKFVKEFIQEWQKDAGITLGESSASSS